MENRINKALSRLQRFNVELAGSGERALQKLEKRLGIRIQSAMDREWVQNSRKNGPAKYLGGASQAVSK